MKHQRLLGIDYGTRRIGLATSTMGISSPFSVLKNNGEEGNIRAISSIVTAEKIDGFVLGVPLNAQGQETPMSQSIRKFGQRLEQLGLPVMYVNEMLSSWEAEEHIKNNLGITSPDKVAALVDKVAASMLLQEYIDNTGDTYGSKNKLPRKI